MNKQKFVAIEFVKFLDQERRRLNRINIMDAVFTKNGKEIKISYKQREEWKYTGLGTTNFVMSELVEDEEA